MLYLAIFLMSFVISVLADYEDIRCVCVCPPLAANSTMKAKKVYRLPNLTPENCNCEYVLDQINVASLTPKELTQFCLRCQCQYEKRQTTTIKVMVIFIICIVTMLFVYMLFLLILDPLMNKTSPSYRPHVDEHIEVDDFAAAGDTESITIRPTRTRNVMQRVRSEQEKWKDTVETQRKHIFDRHTMLN